VPYLKAIFHNALTGVATPLEAKGVAAPGVSWLDAAIKTLLLSTSLPPLREPPIKSVTIDSMEMDFACGTPCVWAPLANSSITADTNLPFANGAPIKQLAQNVQILDKKGRLVGTLNTSYANVTIAGSKVSTKTPQAPLTVDAGSHDIYIEFIKDLNMDSTYELGLRGTADSVLDLGPFLDVEIKGIPIDVNTTIAGLQGLNNIKFVTDVSFISVPPTYHIASTVNIYNPSQLTLNIGDLTLEAGRVTWEPDVRIGSASISKLRLVPGDNYVISTIVVNYNEDLGSKFLVDSELMDIDVTMWASSNSTTNPALNAGLGKLRNSVLVPKGLKVVPKPAYSDVWSIKILPTTVDDSLVEVSTVFYNPYHVDMTVEGTATMADYDNIAFPSLVQIYTPMTSGLSPLMFPEDLAYSVKANGSTPLTFKMKLVDAQKLTKGIDYIVETAKANGVLSIEPYWSPRVRLTNNPGLVFPSWVDKMFYPGPLTLKTGPDFPMIMDWVNKNAPVPTVDPPVVPPPTTPTVPSATLFPSATLSPSLPSVSPVLTPSPLVVMPVA
ncbi:hypothetical protein BGX24_002144, partial [Mortierella sp. AD032]